MWRLALLCSAVLTVTVACADGPGAPNVNTDELSLNHEGDPPPPPLRGFASYSGDPGGLANSDVAPNSPETDCPASVFCVPIRYFENKSHSNESLDFRFEEPLPPFIKQALKEMGMGAVSQGKVKDEEGETDGQGLAYDVQLDGEKVVTIDLDQFDVAMGAGIQCFPAGGVGGGGAGIQQEPGEGAIVGFLFPLVAGLIWERVESENDKGQAEYTSRPTVGAISFTATGGTCEPLPDEEGAL